MKRIAIFGSGPGTNAENIIHYFKFSNAVKPALVLSNKPDAYILERAKKHGVPAYSFNKKDLYETGYILNLLTEHEIDLIVLAGFLKLIPEIILKAFSRKIINIHPALLPLFGGKDMYGDRVHHAVIASGAIMSGISIHYIDAKFDEGELIFQAACHVAKDETAGSLATKIHKLEYRYYPVVIEKVIS